MSLVSRARMPWLLLGALACGGGGGGGGPTPPSETPVASVVLDLSSAILIPQQSQALSATPKAANGNSLAGRAVTWQSGSTGVATVSPAGVVTGVAVGTTQITATSEGKSASATVEVREGAMIGAAGGTVAADGGKLTIVIPAGALATTVPISVAPMANPPGPAPAYGTKAYELGPSGTTFAVPVTLTFAYQTTGLDSLQMLLRVKRLTNGAWLPLTGSATDGEAGKVSAPTSSFSHYYIAHARIPTRIALSPPTGKTLYIGQSMSFSMTVWDQHDQIITPADVDNQLIWGGTNWNSDQGISLSAGGGSALATAVSPGGGGPQLVSVSVSANVGCTAPDGVCYIGTSGGAKIQQVIWNVSVAASAWITVVPVPVRSVSVTPTAPQVTAGNTIQLQATPKDSIGGALDRPVVWTSGDATRASVDGNGLVTTLLPGTVTITATSEGISGSTVVTIVGSTNPVTTVEITGPANTVEVGGTLQLTAIARDALNNVVTGQAVTWTPLTPAVATVSPTGLVTGVAAGGPVGIRATISGVNRTVGISVTAPVPLVHGIPATNERSSCLLRSNGTTWCWGHGASGELGIGATPTSQVSPVQVAGAPTFVSLVMGGSVSGVVDPLQFHACGLTAAGQPWCWGQNKLGQVGDNSTTDRTAPVPVSGSGFTKLFAGTATRTCALQGNGDAYCWGASTHGHNDPGTTIRTVPTKIVSAPAFTTLALSQLTVTCGLAGSGAAWCWGSESNGELGDGDNTVHIRDLPNQVVGGHLFSELVGGDAHFCGLKADGSAWCWGRNSSGQLGDGTTVSRNAPVAVQTALRFTALSAGFGATCGIAMDLTAWCWGEGTRAGNGIGLPNFFVTPTAVPISRTFTRIAVGGHTCGDANDGIWCWGNNSWGQLGNGSTSNTALGPVKVVFPQ